MIDIVTSIVVDLSDQKLYAHTHTGVVHEFIVSTGKATTPTPLMEDVIDNKHEINDLYGPGYYIKDVKYIMCFKNHEIYCIHPNTTTAPLGEPHSMGCVRMNEYDAGWLFNHTPLETPITVQE